MTSKLTLSINSNLIESAKNFSKKKGTSLSKMFEEYLKNVLKTDANFKKESSVRDLRGILGKAPKNFDYKKELMKILEEKYK